MASIVVCVCIWLYWKSWAVSWMKRLCACMDVYIQCYTVRCASGIRCTYTHTYACSHISTVYCASERASDCVYVRAGCMHWIVSIFFSIWFSFEHGCNGSNDVQTTISTDVLRIVCAHRRRWKTQTIFAFSLLLFVVAAAHNITTFAQSNLFK